MEGPSSMGKYTMRAVRSGYQYGNGRHHLTFAIINILFIDFLFTVPYGTFLCRLAILKGCVTLLVAFWYEH